LGQEFIIKSAKLEDKINQLLPSQGGFQAGVDLSASTTVIPIVDLTETAEGSDVRQDLQTALTHGQTTGFSVSNTVSVIGSTTGYFRIFGNVILQSGTSATQAASIQINDGATDKAVFNIVANGTSQVNLTSQHFDFVVYIPAGHTLKAETLDAATVISGCFRQIADISGNLIQPA
jgi:hypothetical protein